MLSENCNRNRISVFKTRLFPAVLLSYRGPFLFYFFTFLQVSFPDLNSFLKANSRYSALLNLLLISRYTYFA